MNPARPLTPPEVRELLAYIDGPTWPVGGLAHLPGDVDLIFEATRHDATLRATLERYAELAEAFGEFVRNPERFGEFKGSESMRAELPDDQREQ